MTNTEILETACDLKALLQCLATVDEDNTTAITELPRALKLASKEAARLYEALTEEV